ncbi:hypothetical protein [Polyangium aurulentum]|uniref:hypothetical protein n=1 Tax=Polyangium aurulentum TaxID=2567896 RepID=UPI0010ADCDFA|nr:hypothetical protein [Polyangium aurulentum]UQA56767.1 hypothetical protein E8A73_036520 [Polyangium aurulentum]
MIAQSSESPSKVWFEEPDTVFVTLNGYIDATAGARTLRAQNACTEGRPYVIVVCDVQRATGMSGEARRQLINNSQGAQARGVVIVGGSYPIRTIASMIFRAATLLGVPLLPFRFANNLAEARALLPELRRALRAVV